jgi:hypothetical protein
MTAASQLRASPRYRGYALPLTLVALALAVVALTSARSTAPRGGGPLDGGNTEVEAGVGMPSLSLGQSFCYGLVVLRNASRRHAVLSRVEVRGGDGLRVGPPLAMGPRRSDTIGTAEACPRGARPLRGYVVPPGSGVRDAGVEVLLPITVLRRGLSRIEGLSVLYTSDHRSYRVDDITNVVACTYACDAGPGGG